MGFDPASLAIMGMVTGALGTGVSAFGASQAADAKAKAAAYQSQVAANNAKIAQQDATLEIQAGEAVATNIGMKTRAKVGSQKANQGASGIDVNTGSAVDVRAGTEAIGVMDEVNARAEGVKRAWAKEVEAQSATAQSQLLQSESEQDKTAGEFAVAGTLLSGASSVGGSWSKYQTLYGGASPASQLAAGMSPV